MTSDRFEPDVRAILEDQGFVQRLARSLVRDEHGAEDLVQQTWLAALEHPPRVHGSLRGWLARVARNLAINSARRDVRRSEREQLTARAETLPPIDAMEMQLELQRHVLDAVQRLDEPYKSVVFLRYYQDLSPDEIATRLSLPVATVKTRLRRALASLRSALDREFGGDRRAWSTALMPLASMCAATIHGASALHAQGGTIVWMGAKTKLAAISVLAAGLALILWQPWRRPRVEPSSAPSVVDASDAVSNASNRSKLELAGAVDARAPAREPVSEPRDALAPHDDDVVFHGRIVDAGRFPVSDVDVDMLIPGQVHAHSRSDAKGEFRIDAGRPPKDRTRNGGVHAVDKEGRCAVRTCRMNSLADLASARRDWLGASEDPYLDLGTFVLESAHSLRARIVDKGEPAADVQVFAEWDSRRIACDEARSDADGYVRFSGLPTGKLLVRAIAPHKEGRRWTFLSAPDDDPLVVELEANRSVELAVVDAKTGAGIPGVTFKALDDVSVDTSLGIDARLDAAEYHTSWLLDVSIDPSDANGRSRADDLPSVGALGIQCVVPGYRELSPARETVKQVPLGATSVRFTLSRKVVERTARWPIEAKEVPLPPDGTTLKLRRSTLHRRSDDPDPPSSARVESGMIVVDALNNTLVDLLAEAPDGSIARLEIDENENEGRPISFRASHTIDVVVRDADGRAVEGARIQAHNQGNNPLNDYVPTDASGHAVLRGLYSELVSVYVRAPASMGWGEIAGVVDLTKGDGRIEYTLPHTVEAELRLRIDGKPMLPSKYRVRAEAIVNVVREDPEKGLVILSVTVPANAKDVPLLFESADFSSAQVKLVLVRDERPRAIEIDFAPSAVVVAHAEQPRNQAVSLRLETWNAEQKKWVTAALNRFFHGMKAPNAPGGAFRFDDCTPGRYRVRDEETNIVSTEAELAAGMRAVDVDIRIASIRKISGVVEAPEGTDFSRVRVLITGEGVGADENGWMRGREMPQGGYVGKTGAFKLTVPGDRTVHVRAWHPFLLPAKDGGVVAIEDARDDVCLRLVAGDEVRIIVPKSILGAHQQSLRIYRYDGEPSGEPGAWFHAPITDGVARFAGISPGKCNLWIDPARNFAPIFLRDVSIVVGITTIDELAVSLGSSLRVHVLVKAGESPPRLYVSAKSRGEPSYYRDINSEGEETIVLSGLGHGTFDVHIGLVGAGFDPDRTIDVDGTSDVELTYDAR